MQYYKIFIQNELVHNMLQGTLFKVEEKIIILSIILKCDRENSIVWAELGYHKKKKMLLV